MADAPPVPLPAATIVVARRTPHSDEGDYEVLLVKRHGKSGFMAGVHVFPGGKVDADDGGAGADPAVVCAIRETFEEVAVLFARPESGIPLTSRGPIDAVSARTAAGEPFLHALNAAGLVLDTSALVPIAWWVTPEAEPRRFDTRFFFAEVPALQRDTAQVDDTEVEDGLWLTPKAALRAVSEERIKLAPPTLVTLEELQGHLLNDVARTAWPMTPICPRLCDVDGELVLALPGDPLHDEPTRRLWANRTRVVMRDGRFVSAVG